MAPWIFLGIGLLLILVEFYLPGAIMGITGGTLLLISIILFAVNTSSVLAIIAYIVGVVVCVAFLVKFALWRIKSSKPQYSIYSNAHQEGYQASTFDATAIGKKGVVVTDLKPGGHVLVEGKRLQAISQSGYLVKGTEVLVIGGQEESLIVKIIQKEPPV